MELDRLEPKELREFLVVGPDLVQERLGLLAADEELDGVLGLGAHHGEDEHERPRMGPM